MTFVIRANYFICVYLVNFSAIRSSIFCLFTTVYNFTLKMDHFYVFLYTSFFALNEYAHQQINLLNVLNFRY